METLKEIFSKGYEFNETILNAAENKRLVFFVGAGVSRIMGISGWEDFANDIIKSAFKDFNKQKTLLTSIKDNKEKITVAFKEFESSGRLKEFYKHFGKAMKPNQKIFNKVIKTKGNIYEILNKFQALFLTTNADNLFEDVLGPTFCYDDFSDSYLTDKHFRETNRLFYLHGHYKKELGVNHHLVFTADSYVERYNDTTYQKFLKQIFQDQENVIIFIGYGLNEFELIDYIATKTGIITKNADEMNRRYILYGFCSEEDTLFWAKKSYFETLGITLIPYCMDSSGHESLIDVLKDLYDKYSPKVIPPIAESIEHFIIKCDDENVEGLLRYLNDPEQAKIFDSKIFQEISLHDKYKWIEALNDKGYFSGNNLLKGIESGKWSLLELFAEWIYENSDNNKKAQEAGAQFLSDITKKQLTDLSTSYSFIKNHIINIILSLDEKHIDNKYLDYIKSLNINLDKFYTAIYPSCNFKNTFKWNNDTFEYFLKVLFNGMTISSNEDINYYYTDIILKKILQEAAKNQDYIRIILNYFTDRLISDSLEQPYNVLLYKFDLDNLDKHDGYYYLLLIVLKNCFNKLVLAEKNCYLSGLLQLNSILSKKLALYLARTNNTALDIDFSNFDFYSDHEYYCEFFLFIKKLFELGSLNSCAAERIAKKVERADWGYFKWGKTITEEDRKYIDSKRLAVLQILPCKYAEQKSNELISTGIAPYNVIEVAKKCDIMTVEEVKVYSKSDFDSIDINKWVAHLKESLPSSKSYELSTASQEFIEYLSDKNKDDKKIVINNLIQIPIEQLNYIVWSIFSKIEKFIDNIDDIIDFSLSVLAKAKLEKKYFSLIKSVLYLLKKAQSFCPDVHLSENIIGEIAKYLTISIDDEIYDSSKTDLLSFIINLGDYEKITLWLNCLITLKEKTNRDEFDEEYDKVSELLNKKDDNIRYTLCYYYQNLNYLFGDKTKDLFNKLIYTNSVFDISALEICIAGSNTILSEYVNTIISEYIEKRNYPKVNPNRNILEDRFYSLIISAHYYNRINDTQLLGAFNDKNFLDYYFKHISLLYRMDKFNIEKQIGIAWNYIKDLNNNQLIVSYSANVLLSIHFIKDNGYTDKLIDILVEAVKFVSVNLDMIDLKKYIPFYNLDFIKAHGLIMSIVKKLYYLADDTIKAIIETYKRTKKTREGKELIVLLGNQNIISIDKRTELKNFLEQ